MGVVQGRRRHNLRGAAGLAVGFCDNPVEEIEADRICA